MTTGAYWNVKDNPLKPWGWFDVNAKILYPFDWVTWLADSGTTYASHTCTAEAPLEIISSSQISGVIIAKVGVLSGETPVDGQKYAITCHIVCANGEEEDQTLYLKIRQK